jgi:hypothetical protein
MKVIIELKIFVLKFVISILKLVCSRNFRDFFGKSSNPT